MATSTTDIARTFAKRRKKKRKRKAGMRLIVIEAVDAWARARRR